MAAKYTGPCAVAAEHMHDHLGRLSHLIDAIISDAYALNPFAPAPDFGRLNKAQKKVRRFIALHLHEAQLAGRITPVNDDDYDERTKQKTL